MKKTIGILFMFALLSVSSMTANAANLASYGSNDSVLTNVGEQDFLLINKTGVEIYALYVTPNSAKNWGDDVLGVDTLPAGESTTIHFSPGTKATFWDLRVEDEDGNYIEWDKFNLKKISVIELYYKDGNATAVFN